MCGEPFSPSVHYYYACSDCWQRRYDQLQLDLGQANEYQAAAHADHGYDDVDGGGQFV